MPHTDIATRAMIVSLKASNKTTIEVMALTGVGKSTINSIFARAVARGFDPAVRPIVLTDALLADNPRSGRPSKQSAAKEEVMKLSLRHRDFGYVDLANTPQGWLPEDQAYEEAWSDTEDEERTARMVPRKEGLEPR